MACVRSFSGVTRHVEARHKGCVEARHEGWNKDSLTEKC
jgi:hypothetical protein